ncbi:MAG: FkbM family methyltransferase [Gammaproteobacteria bacterium]|jgi:FkbM family methyltransferase
MMSLKEMLRQACPPMLWELAKSLRKRNAPPTRQYYGLQELDRRIEQHVDFNNGFFIEIGGWDGVTFSNSLYFERFRNWRGLLIEPAPNEFLKCRVNRPDATVVCSACVPFGYANTFLPMSYCASMTVAHSAHNAKNQLDDVRRHLDSGQQFLKADETSFEFGARAAPLSQILDECAIDCTIDLLVLDVEGQELSVLQGIDFARHAPRYICVEVWKLDTIASYLSSQGYRMVEQLTHMDDHQDFLFVRE